MAGFCVVKRIKPRSESLSTFIVKPIYYRHKTIIIVSGEIKMYNNLVASVRWPLYQYLVAFNLLGKYQSGCHILTYDK